MHARTGRKHSGLGELVTRAGLGSASRTCAGVLQNHAGAVFRDASEHGIGVEKCDLKQIAFS